MNRALVAFALGCGAMAALAEAPLGHTAQSDLDAFMARVLARRDENWKKLQQYVLDERERTDLEGPGGTPLWGEDRTYTWYIRDGFFVRSPVTANGVTLAAAERREYEEEFLRRARQRDADRDDEDQEATIGRAAGASGNVATGSGDASGDLSGLLAQTRQPRFIDTAYFLRFKFEQGTYALVGRETLGGDEVLRIEYYPTRLFSHEQEAADRRRAEDRLDRREDVEAAMERLMNKVSLVTLWITPTTHQIIKYTFDNVHLDFLPASWLVRIDDIEATMTMGQPFDGVWLPRDVDVRLAATLALGPVTFQYHVDYFDYREATTAARVLPAE